MLCLVRSFDNVRTMHTTHARRQRPSSNNTRGIKDWYSGAANRLHCLVCCNTMHPQARVDDNWSFQGWQRQQRQRQQQQQQPAHVSDEDDDRAIVVVDRRDLAEIQDKKLTKELEAALPMQQPVVAAGTFLPPIRLAPVQKPKPLGGIEYCWAHQVRFVVPPQPQPAGDDEADRVPMPRRARKIDLQGRQWKHVSVTSDDADTTSHNKVRAIDEYLLHLEVRHRLIVGSKSLSMYYQDQSLVDTLASASAGQQRHDILQMIPYGEACHELGTRERFGILMAARAADVERHLVQRGRPVVSKNLCEIALMHGHLVAPREHLIIWKAELAAGVRCYAKNATAATRLVPVASQRQGHQSLEPAVPALPAETTLTTSPSAGIGQLEGKTEEERMLEVVVRARDDAVGHFADSNEPAAAIAAAMADARNDASGYRLSMPAHWHRLLQGISYWKFREAPNIRSVAGQRLRDRAAHAQAVPYRRF